MIAGAISEIGTIWTAATIASRYESEKVLFDPEEIFSVQDDTLVFEVGLRGGHNGVRTDKNTNISKSGARETLVHSQKQPWIAQTVSMNKRKRREANKFLRGTANGQSFTYGERSALYAPYNDREVYRVGGENDLIPRGADRDWETC